MAYPDLATVVFALPALLLSVLLLIFTFIRQNRPQNAKDRSVLKSMAIVIPFRSEGAGTLNQAKYFGELFRESANIPIYWIDDHSSHHPEELAEYTADRDGFHLLSSTGKPGKKHAIHFALNTLNTEWIFLMDVDSRPNKTILSLLQTPIDRRCKMLLAPIRPKPSLSLLRKFFDLDFISLHFAGLKSILIKQPLLANGAAMLINRKAYFASIHHRKDWDINSGDDVFSMMAMSKELGYHAIGILPVDETAVEVSFPNSFSDLWAQRTRWVSKVGRVSGGWFQFVSWLVLAGVLAFFPLAWLSINLADPVAFAVFVALLIAQIVYLTTACIGLQRKDLLWMILPAIFLYPFYLVSVVATSIFTKPNWK